MAIRAVVDISIHFDHFRNVDLFHQGLYRLSARVYREEPNEETIFAVPLGGLSERELVQQKKSTPNHHNLIPPQVDEGSCNFSTQSFLVRYCEEEVELNVIGQFRIELSEADVTRVSATLSLEVQLMFADLSHHGGVDRFEEQPDLASTEFKSVSSQVFKVHGVSAGVHASCPVVFDEYHFCVANVAVHSSLVGFRMRTSAAPSGAGTCISFAECAFGGGGATTVQLLRSCEGAYKRYLGVLAERYAGLCEWFQMICDVCLTPGHIAVFEGLLEIPQLRTSDGLPVSTLCGSHPDGGVNGTSAGRIDLRSFLLARIRQEPKEGDIEHTLAAGLMYDLNIVSGKFLELWNVLHSVLLIVSKEVMMLLRSSWEQRVVEQMKVSVLREGPFDALTANVGKSVSEAHDREAAKLRKGALKLARPVDGTPFVEDQALLPDMRTHPIVFDQRHSSAAGDGMVRLTTEPKLYRGVHLFVLVHGFQGNSFDMRLMKNNIALLYPEAIFLCSNSNEDNTDGDFTEMGIRLAQEVVNYICDWCPGSALGRLSFIAHSIGGVITRSALPLLQEYKDKMCTFLTLSSPHAGYFSNHMSLFSMGFKVLQTWRKSQCLTQLSMHDNPDPKQTYLYKLSKAKGFEFFRHIVLVSCASDQYGPLDSARVEIGGMLSSHASIETYSEMVHNIWEPVDPKNVYRLDVNFHIAEQSLDSVIGRAAHIQFLECQRIMRALVLNYSFLFR